MQYEDVRIQIRPGQTTETASVVLDSDHHGQREEPFNATFAEQSIEVSLMKLEEELLRCITGHYEKSLDEKQLGLMRGQLARNHHKLGLDLYNALLHGEVGSTFELDWYAHVDGQLPEKDGLRIRLVFDPRHRNIAPLASLPWELLVRKLRFSENAVAQSRKATLIRDLETGKPRKWLGIEGSLRVLVVVSSPDDLAPVTFKDEIRGIKKVFSQSKLPAEIEVLELKAPAEGDEVSLQEIRNRLIEEQHHVLHFIGHGGFDPATGNGGLALVGTDGNKALRSGRLVANSLRDLDALRLVVLCSCSGASLPRRAGLHPFLNVAPALLAVNIPAVVAMQFPISHTAAALFSRNLYRSLARAEPVDVAMGEARLAILNKTEIGFEWATPVLFCRSEDCQIVSRDAEAAKKQPTLTKRPEPQHLGIRTFKGGWGAGMKERCDELFLDLSDVFDPETGYRLICEDAMWETEIVPRLRTFLSKVDTKRPVVMELAAHNSIAFTVGSLFEAKSGLDITVRQRGQKQHWSSEAAVQPSYQDWSGAVGDVPSERVWDFADIVPGEGLGEGLVVDANAKDVALAISVTHDIRLPVVEYIRRKKIPVRRVLTATMLPGPGQTTIVSGAHALSLALDLTHHLGQRAIEEHLGMLHIFAAAPSIFMVLLGQQSRTFGVTQLYEHDFESRVPWAYLPSIADVPPRWRRYQ